MIGDLTGKSLIGIDYVFCPDFLYFRMICDLTGKRLIGIDYVFCPECCIYE